MTGMCSTYTDALHIYCLNYYRKSFSNRDFLRVRKTYYNIDNMLNLKPSRIRGEVGLCSRTQRGGGVGRKEKTAGGNGNPKMKAKQNLVLFNR
jgi:hypothetical protein